MPMKDRKLLYTISEAAEKMGLTAHTLRFYDKEGLLPFVDRSSGGIRMFKDEDFEWLKMIECLKCAGMPLKDIKTFIDWCLQGDATIQQRYDMFCERKKIVEDQMSTLQKTLDVLNFKCRYYEEALRAGTTDVHFDLKPEDLPEALRVIKAKPELKYDEKKEG